MSACYKDHGWPTRNALRARFQDIFKTKIDTHDICCTLYVANSIQMLCKAFTLSRAANRVSCLAGCAGCAVLHHWVHEANHNSRVTFLVKVYFRTMFDDYFLPTLTIRPPPQRLLYISFFFLVHVFLFCPSLQATKAAEFKVGPRYVDSKYIGEGVSCRVFRRACFPNAIPPVPLPPSRHCSLAIQF